MAYSVIKKPSDYFNTKLWSGNGSSQALTGVGHQTDMVWIKSRTDTRKHNLYDVVRGVQQRIVPNDGAAEDTVPGVTAFGADGFTVGSETDTNGSSRNFVGWSWNANGAGVANTDGSISSTVSANTTSGFSIVSYTGTGSNATIGHGLGATPQVVLIKELNGTNNWLMSHQPLSASLGDYTRFMVLNSASAVSGAGNVVFQNSAFTSSYFNVGTSAGSNGSGQNYIAYCFAEKKGFSKFGSYTGNGNADGTFVYTGFKPAFVMTKRTDATSNWHIFDSKRDVDNGVTFELRANTTDAETDVFAVISQYRADFLSNGFKIKTTESSMNASGGSYIYMAFAEQPLVGDNPATAR